MDSNESPERLPDETLYWKGGEAEAGVGVKEAAAWIERLFAGLDADEMAAGRAGPRGADRTASATWTLRV